MIIDIFEDVLLFILLSSNFWVIWIRAYLCFFEFKWLEYVLDEENNLLQISHLKSEIALELVFVFYISKFLNLYVLHIRYIELVKG